MADDALGRINGDPGSAALWDELLGLLEGLGDHAVEVKKGSLHVTHGRAFLGVHPRKGALLLNIVLTERLEGERIRRAEKVSANRWHNELLVSAPGQIDAELRAWISAAYSLTS